MQSLKKCLIVAIFIICWMIQGQTAKSASQPNHDEWSINDPRWDSPLNWLADDFVAPLGPAEESSQEFWNSKAQATLKQKLSQNLNFNRAKNVVIMIGDGMGLSTTMAARSYLKDVSAELEFEKFPHSGMSKVYCVNYQVPDSACTGTAILRGVKVNFLVIGCSADVNFRNCTESLKESSRIPSIFEHAQDAGKSTGFVTTTKVTDSTVAATYAYSGSRFWEDNVPSQSACDDIGKQLVHGPVGSKLDVILGGGLGNLVPVNVGGKRKDGMNLVDDYKRQHEKSSVVYNRTELNAVDAKTADKLLGLFANGYMNFKLLADDESQPTLMEMTAKALDVLKKNQDGFVLLVEGGRIDSAHHLNRARLSLEEVVEFNKAVEYVKQNTDEKDTLIVVTADHSHSFIVSGDIPRGENILGPGDYSFVDNKWIFAASYSIGPGYHDHIDKATGERINLKGMKYMDPNFRQPSMVPKDFAPHSGEDVGVYASGPYSHLFTGVYEQNYIAHAMMYAACLGPNDVLKNPKCQDE